MFGSRRSKQHGRSQIIPNDWKAHLANALGLTEAAELLGTAEFRLLSLPPKMSFSETSCAIALFSNKYFEAATVPLERSQVEVHLYAGELLNVMSSVVNPVQANGTITEPTLEGLKHLRSSYVVLSAFTNFDQGEMRSFEGTDICLQSSDGIIVEPELTPNGGYRFPIERSKIYTIIQLDSDARVA